MTRKQRQQERAKKFNLILKEIKNLEKKFSKDEIRWALNRHARTESKKASLLKQKAQLDKELADL